LGWI